MGRFWSLGVAFSGCRKSETSLAINGEKNKSQIPWILFYSKNMFLDMEECKAWEAAAIRDEDIVNTLASLIGLAQEIIPTLQGSSEGQHLDI
nr:hypothetical protein CFP56_65008 [Quercus suber]